MQEPVSGINVEFNLAEFNDTIIGKNHKGEIVIIDDRTTSRVRILKLSRKEAASLAKKTASALRKVKLLLYTFTADNGKEFAKDEEIA